VPKLATISAFLVVRRFRATEISIAKPICGRATTRNVQGLVAAIRGATEPHGVLVSVKRFNEHSGFVLAANRLRAAPDNSETRRVCSAPIVVVQSNGKVAQTKRIHL
jgi:hypothetical protein